jgi:hypothetical protein
MPPSIQLWSLLRVLLAAVGAVGCAHGGRAIQPSELFRAFECPTGDTSEAHAFGNALKLALAVDHLEVISHGGGHDQMTVVERGAKCAGATDAAACSAELSRMKQTWLRAQPTCSRLDARLDHQPRRRLAVVSAARDSDLARRHRHTGGRLASPDGASWVGSLCVRRSCCERIPRLARQHRAVEAGMDVHLPADRASRDRRVLRSRRHREGTATNRGGARERRMLRALAKVDAPREWQHCDMRQAASPPCARLGCGYGLRAKETP